VGQSQVFLAIAPTAFATQEELSAIAQGAIDAVHAATPIVPGKPARYPGEGVLAARAESARLGVGVEDAAWAAFLKLDGQS
jgi:3-dehydro-L-gulonate 2-dehydrogenase